MLKFKAVWRFDISHQTISRDAHACMVIGLSDNFFKRRIIGGLLEQL